MFSVREEYLNPPRLSNPLFSTYYPYRSETFTILIQKKKVNGSQQLLRFHLLRYYRNLNWIHSFFTDNGYVFGVSEDMDKWPQNI